MPGINYKMSQYLCCKLLWIIFEDVTNHCLNCGKYNFLKCALEYLKNSCTGLKKIVFLDLFDYERCQIKMRVILATVVANSTPYCDIISRYSHAHVLGFITAASFPFGSGRFRPCNGRSEITLAFLAFCDTNLKLFITINIRRVSVKL